MTNIALDTNIWIYLTKDTFYELWIKFRKMHENNQIRVILNDVILKEWERNRSTTLKMLALNIKNEYKSAINLSNYLDEPFKTKYLKVISAYKKERTRIEKAENRVREIENFMKTCELIKVTQEQKLFVASLAIDKAPPFQQNKNNFNDALILRNICEYVENEIPNRYDLIYVSNNPADFTDSTTKEVYKTLLKDLHPIRLKNVTELGEALKLAPELIEDFEDWLEYQIEYDAEYQYDLMRGK
jgi:predicted nucleic acid-binding protein